MFSHILVATDGSELAQKGVDHAISLARPSNAKITFVTVTEPFPLNAIPGEGSMVGANEFQAYQRRSEESAKTILANAQGAAERFNLQSEGVHVADRRPADTIVAAAKEHGCNLIVMASHGRRGLGRLLLGSQTVDVLTHSAVPVLVVK